MIYLSRLIFDARSKRAQSEAHNPYELHRSLARGFGDDSAAQAAARCLFRIEGGESGAFLTALVQSKSDPDWQLLGARGGPGYLVSSQVKELNTRFSAGRQLAFRLRANPTVARDGKRTGLYDDESRAAWFARKAEAAGFAPIMLRVTDEEAVKAKRKDSDQPAVFSSARFDGILQVTDPEKLSEAMENGIGAAKGFGFGLLTLAKA